LLQHDLGAHAGEDEDGIRGHLGESRLIQSLRRGDEQVFAAPQQDRPALPQGCDGRMDAPECRYLGRRAAI